MPNLFSAALSGSDEDLDPSLDVEPVPPRALVGLFDCPEDVPASEVAVQRPARQKPERSRGDERRRLKLLADITPPDASSCPTGVVKLLRDTLVAVDPEYKRALKAAAMMSAVSRGLQHQGADDVSVGVKRAVKALVADGLDEKRYSAGDAASLLRCKASALRGKRDRESGTVASSTSEAVTKKRKARRDKFSSEIERAVREFAYAHCKFEEKTYVSLLTCEAVWLLYCKHHDCHGNFFTSGTCN